MYSYTHDSETGGLLLNSTPTGYSKEPRPVYAAELDILGFDAFWEYEKQNEIPYLWAEHNEYFYRGQHVAKVKGGDLRTKPKIEILAEINENLRRVDIAAMNKKNSELLEVIEKAALKRIFDVYKRHREKVDVFYVAFSGGKDSLVLLNLVKQALSKEQFVVVFGDTGMEFPDTMQTVAAVEKQCKWDGIVFLRATSVYSPQESWELFGPPARRLRWCCSVHKSVPQTLKLREYLHKNDYTGCAFVGVRRPESLARSKYEDESFSAKVQGQHSSNSILHWTSAEVWTYSYFRNLLVNDAYKKGHLRAGCIICPTGGGKDDYMRQCCYSDEFGCYTDIIKRAISGDENKKKHYVENDNWRARLNGRDIQANEKLRPRYIEKVEKGFFLIEVKMPRTNWQEWAKPLGKLGYVQSRNRKVAETEYTLLFDGKEYKFYLVCDFNCDNYTVRIDEQILKNNPAFAKLFKCMFRKAAYCVGCRLCECNCRFGCISFEKGLTISCKHCKNRDCYNVDEGCLVANSIRIPIGKSMRDEVKINCFTHAPKPEWVRDFFEKKHGFWTDNNLNPNLQVPAFKRFLRDSCLIDKDDRTTPTFAVVENIGNDTATAWGIILSQFAYNPEMQWFIENLEFGIDYTRQEFVDMLLAKSNCKKNDTSYTFGGHKCMFLPRRGGKV
jgi:phosphoadenosine phosphosulfate reductase